MSTLLNYRETDPVLRMLLLRWRIVLILSFALNLFGGFSTGGQTVKIRQRLPRLPEHFFRQ